MIEMSLLITIQDVSLIPIAWKDEGFKLIILP